MWKGEKIITNTLNQDILNTFKNADVQLSKTWDKTATLIYFAKKYHKLKVPNISKESPTKIKIT